jgi:two-component system NarL family response regulator
MSESEQDLFEAVKSGASGYLLKRLDAEEFFAYLAELQAGHPPFSPGLAEKILREFAHQGVQSENRPAPASTAAEQAGGSLENEPQEGGLSSRQIQILTLVAQGQTYRQVAEIIGIAERTVKYHMAEILDRLHRQPRRSSPRRRAGLTGRGSAVTVTRRHGTGDATRDRRPVTR